MYPQHVPHNDIIQHNMSKFIMISFYIIRLNSSSSNSPWMELSLVRPLSYLFRERQLINLSHIWQGLFKGNNENIIAADALCPRIDRSSAAMILTEYNNDVLVFLESDSLEPAPFNCRRMIGNPNTYFNGLVQDCSISITKCNGDIAVLHNAINLCSPKKIQQIMGWSVAV